MVVGQYVCLSVMQKKRNDKCKQYILNFITCYISIQKQIMYKIATWCDPLFISVRSPSSICRSTLKMFITSRRRAYALFKRCIDRMHYDKGCQRLLKYSTMLGHIDHRLTFSKSITRNKGKEKLKHWFIFFIHQFLGQQVVKF